MSFNAVREKKSRKFPNVDYQGHSKYKNTNYYKNDEINLFIESCAPLYTPSLCLYLTYKILDSFLNK